MLKRILITVVVLLSTLSIEAQADNILKSNDQFVEIKKDGSALVRHDFVLETDNPQYWSYEVDTTHFKYSSFRINDNEEYDLDEMWDEKDSRAVNERKFGLKHNDNSLTVMWGARYSSEGKYRLEYTIDNLVQKFSDGQIGFTYCFFDSKNDWENYSLTIQLEDGRFNEKNVELWYLGDVGNIVVNDGELCFETDKKVNKYDKVVLMMKFDENQCTPMYLNESSFEHLKKVSFDDYQYRRKLNAFFVVYKVIMKYYIVFIALFGGFAIWIANTKNEKYKTVAAIVISSILLLFGMWIFILDKQIILSALIIIFSLLSEIQSIKRLQLHK